MSVRVCVIVFDWTCWETHRRSALPLRWCFYMDECREQTEFFPLWTTLCESVFAWVWVFNSACKWVGLHLPADDGLWISWLGCNKLLLTLGFSEVGRQTLPLLDPAPPCWPSRLIGSENDRDGELGPAVSGQMPLIHRFSTSCNSPPRFYNTSAKMFLVNSCLQPILPYFDVLLNDTKYSLRTNGEQNFLLFIITYQMVLHTRIESGRMQVC